MPQVERLVDLADVRSLIVGKTIEDTILIGPAMIALLGGVVMQECSFDGDENSLFVEVPGDRVVQGVIGMQDCTIRRCRFQNVGIIGVADALAKMREELRRGTEVASPHEESPPPEELPQAPE